MTTRKIRSTTWLLSIAPVWLVIASPASAADAASKAIKVSSTALYLNEGVGSAEIRRECDWNKRLITELVEDSDEDMVASDENLAIAPGRVLIVHVTSVQAGGGRNYSRSNWAQIRGVLKEGDRVVGNFDARVGREVLHDAEACEELNRFAEQLAEVVAEWVEDPSVDARLGDWDH